MRKHQHLQFSQLKGAEKQRTCSALAYPLFAWSVWHTQLLPKSSTVTALLRDPGAAPLGDCTLLWYMRCRARRRGTMGMQDSEAKQNLLMCGATVVA
jgi:hypothetical protein